LSRFRKISTTQWLKSAKTEVKAGYFFPPFGFFFVVGFFVAVVFAPPLGLSGV